MVTWTWKVYPPAMLSQGSGDELITVNMRDSCSEFSMSEVPYLCEVQRASLLGARKGADPNGSTLSVHGHPTDPFGARLEETHDAAKGWLCKRGFTFRHLPLVGADGRTGTNGYRKGYRDIVPLLTLRLELIWVIWGETDIFFVL